MKSFLIFTGKELKEHLRAWRLVPLCAVFLLFGILSPATAKYMPEILKLAGGSTGGFSITMPPSTALDSYVQFFKNINGVGIIVLLLVFSGAVAGEKSKGSVQLMLTKNLSRPAFVLAKFTGAVIVWTAAYTLGALVCQGYTMWFFPDAALQNVLLSYAVFWLYGLVLLALTTLASAVAGGFGLAALGAFAGWGLMMLSMVPQQIAKYSPAALGSFNVSLIAAANAPGDLLVPVLGAVALAALALGLGCFALKRQEL